MLRDKKLFLLDMDGTIYHEDKLIEGALDFLKTLKIQKKEYVFITNNSSKSVDVYIEKMKKFGVEAENNNFYTSSQATIDYVKKVFKSPKAYVVGTEAFKKELEINGIKIIDDISQKIDVLIVGFDTEINYKKIEDASKLLFTGIEYLATNLDLACPISGERFIPDCGAICEMLFLATGKKPLYMGKPRKELVEEISKLRNIEKNEIAIVGDRLYTDIACGINAGITSILVLTGEAQKKDLETTEYNPDFVFNSIKEIFELIKK